jgi:hypothetical protein
MEQSHAGAIALLINGLKMKLPSPEDVAHVCQALGCEKPPPPSESDMRLAYDRLIKVSMNPTVRLEASSVELAMWPSAPSLQSGGGPYVSSRNIAWEVMALVCGLGVHAVDTLVVRGGIEDLDLLATALTTWPRVFGSLRRLEVTHCYELSKAASLLRLPNLAVLHLDGGGYTLDDLSALEALPKLSELRMTSCHRLASVEDLVSRDGAMPSLVSLELRCCMGLVSLSGVMRMSKLATLVVTYATAVPACDVPFDVISRGALASLPSEMPRSLARVGLRGCPIRDVGVLCDLPNLASLDLRDTLLHDVSGLERATKLACLEVTQGVGVGALCKRRGPPVVVRTTPPGLVG